jgi:signal transduction histidine kinase
LSTQRIESLVIDDDPVVRQVMANQLRRMGHEVSAAENGLKGLELFRERAPDLVLVDLYMPVMGGMEVLSRVHKESPETPIIVVSGLGSLDDAIKALRLGAWDYLTKPVKELSVLEHTINKALERSRLLHENKRYQEFLENEVQRRTQELEQANQELMHTQKQLWYQLEQAQKLESIGMLSGGIAHDFNTILGTILFSTEMTMESLPPYSQEYANLERVVKVCGRGKELVQRILTFTRKSKQQFRRVPAAEVVNECVQFLKTLLPSSVELLLELEQGDAAVEGDPIQIQQMIMNLVTNSVHAMREQEQPRLRISVGTWWDPEPGSSGRREGEVGYVRISVSDNGQGITQADLENIFSPLFTTKGGGEGSGLGLYVVRELVRSHRGRIAVSSDPGKGSEFTILLPQVEAGAGREKRKRRRKARPAGAETILLADDDADFLASMKLALEGAGYSILTASDGAEALDSYLSNEESVKLAVIDHDMPRMPGPVLCRRLHEINPRLPVILLTGRLDDFSGCREAVPNIKSVLFKPIDKEALALGIQSILQP